MLSLRSPSISNMSLRKYTGYDTPIDWGTHRLSFHLYDIQVNTDRSSPMGARSYLHPEQHVRVADPGPATLCQVVFRNYIRTDSTQLTSIMEC